MSDFRKAWQAIRNRLRWKWSDDIFCLLDPNVLWGTFPKCQTWRHTETFELSWELWKVVADNLVSAWSLSSRIFLHILLRSPRQFWRVLCCLLLRLWKRASKRCYLPRFLLCVTCGCILFRDNRWRFSLDAQSCRLIVVSLRLVFVWLTLGLISKILAGHPSMELTFGIVCIRANTWYSFWLQLLFLL